MNHKTVQEQFGANAAEYITSKTHAQGASLHRMVELTKPGPGWKVLDIATGTGHTALKFAPYVAQVWSTDITPEMLGSARDQARQRNLNNVTVEYADAENLPYETASFNLVTCRIAPHHFTDIDRFLRESTRVLHPGGTLAIVDNIVPIGPAGDYINAFEKLRDPSHGRCLSIQEWLGAFNATGLTVLHHETLDKQVDFESWAARHNTVMQRYLLALLTQAPKTAARFLKPQTIHSRMKFHLQEGIMIGKR